MAPQKCVRVIRQQPYESQDLDHSNSEPRDLNPNSEDFRHALIRHAEALKYAIDHNIISALPDAARDFSRVKIRKLHQRGNDIYQVKDLSTGQTVAQNSKLVFLCLFSIN